MATMSFIGSGTMGTALATAACKGSDPGEFVLTDIDRGKAETRAKQLGCVAVDTNAEAVLLSRYIVFCVKPQFLRDVLLELAPTVQECAARGEEKILVSIVAGVESKTILELLGLKDGAMPVIRLLPNTACLIGKGFSLIMRDSRYTAEQVGEFMEILRESGGFDIVPAKQFVAGTVLTSTSPSFIAMFANALADGGVYNGLLREQARRYALEGMLGTVQLLLSSDKHLEALKDDVCSPAGPAIYGVKHLEDSGFRSSVIGAVATACKRFDEIGRSL